MPWGDIDLVAETATVDEDGGVLNTAQKASKGMKFLAFTGNASEEIVSEIEKIDALIASTIASIEADEKVKQCISGRTVQGMKTGAGRNDLTGAGRFPQLASTARTMVGNAVLASVRNNYYKKYDELRLKEAKDIANLASKMSEYDAIEAAHAEELRALEMEKQRLEMETQAEIARINAETERQIQLATSQAQIEEIKANAQIKIAEKTAELEVTKAEKQAEIDKVVATTQAEVSKTQNEAKQAAAAVNKDACLKSVGTEQTSQAGRSCELNSSGMSSSLTCSVNKKSDVREEVKTATFNQSTNGCTLVTKTRTCKNINRNLSDDKRYCKKWYDWTESTQAIRF